MRTLLILAAGRLQTPAFTTAREMGLRVVGADGDASAPGLALADAVHIVDIADPQAVLDIARRERVDGVVHICSEVSMLAMGTVNETLGLHGIDAATARRATNKELMRRAFEAGGAPTPRSIGARTADEARAAAEEVGWPLIVKPSRNSGSRGVTCLMHPCGERLERAFAYALSESRDASVVIEEYVEGPEFSVEILACNGRVDVLTVTDKQTTGPPHFVETGHSQPTGQPSQAREAIEDAAVRGVRALGIHWAAAHAEVKLSPAGPRLMEVGARLGGDFITTELVRRSTGIDMVRGAIQLALGIEPDLSREHAARGAAIRYCLPRPGRVVAIEGLQEALAMPGVQIAEVYVRPGQYVGEVTSSLMRAGHVIAEGATAGEAIARAQAGRDAIRIITEATGDTPPQEAPRPSDQRGAARRRRVRARSV